MNPTKKQRREVYLRAAESIDARKHSWLGCCEVIKRITKDRVIGKDLFPELYLFKPDYSLECCYWWNNSLAESKQERVLALLLCAEMCR